MKMELMALQAEEGLVLDEKVFGDTSMDSMTDATVFHDRCMLEDIRSLVRGMACPAKIVHIFGCGLGRYEFPVG
jgi:hypothetical protein